MMITGALACYKWWLNIFSVDSTAYQPVELCNLMYEHQLWSPSILKSSSSLGFEVYLSRQIFSYLAGNCVQAATAYKC